MIEGKSERRKVVKVVAEYEYQLPPSKVFIKARTAFEGKTLKFRHNIPKAKWIKIIKKILVVNKGTKEIKIGEFKLTRYHSDGLIVVIENNPYRKY